MDLALVVALAVTVALLVVACALLGVVLAGGRRTRRALDASRAEVQQLAARIERVERAPRPRPAVPEQGYLITDAGTAGAGRAADRDRARTRLVVSAGLTEPLVKVLAFGYGVRSALSPQNRNRIRFEMRREVRHARKARRRAARRAPRQAAT